LFSACVTPKNDGLDALATALATSRNERLVAVDPEADSEVLRLGQDHGSVPRARERREAP
jgi:hypothetical protein